MCGTFTNVRPVKSLSLKGFGKARRLQRSRFFDAMLKGFIYCHLDAFELSNNILRLSFFLFSPYRF